MSEPYRALNHYRQASHGHTHPFPVQPPSHHLPHANHRSHTDPAHAQRQSPPPPVPLLPPSLTQLPNPHPVGLNVLQRPRAQTAKSATNVLHRRRPVTAGAYPNPNSQPSGTGTHMLPLVPGANVRASYDFSSAPPRPPPPLVNRSPVPPSDLTNPHDTPIPYRRSFAAPSPSGNPVNGWPTPSHRQSVAGPPPPIPLRPSGQNLVPNHPPALRPSLSHNSLTSFANWGTPSPTPPALPPLPPSLRAGFLENTSKPPLPPKNFTSPNEYRSPQQSPHKTTSPFDRHTPNPRLSLPPPIPPLPPSLSSGNLFFESSGTPHLAATSPSPMAEPSSSVDGDSTTPSSTSPKPEPSRDLESAEDNDLTRALQLSEESYRKRALRDKEEGESISFAVAMSRESKSNRGSPSGSSTPTHTAMPPQLSSLVNAAAYPSSRSASGSNNASDVRSPNNVSANDGWEHYDPRMFEGSPSSAVRPAHVASSVSAPSVLTTAHLGPSLGTHSSTTSRQPTPRIDPVELSEEPRDVELPTYNEIEFDITPEEPPPSRSAPVDTHIPPRSNPVADHLPASQHRSQPLSHPVSARAVGHADRRSYHPPPPANPANPSHSPAYPAPFHQAASHNSVGSPASSKGPSYSGGYDQMSHSGPSSGPSRRSKSVQPPPSATAREASTPPPLPTPNRSRAGTGVGNREDMAGPSPTISGLPLAVGELFAGVSYGFDVPTITQTTSRSQSPMFPDAFALDNGSAFHVMAPNYRHLLRLLAHLSSTNIQPTPGAIAACKDPCLSLRATLQFAKVPFTEAEFRTVLWLELDTPVPPLLPGGWKFTNGDTTHLPYSTSIPPPVKHSPPSSQIFVLQGSLPELPISFPSLAMYLHGAFIDSKRAADTLGIRRLSKIVVACYGAAESGEAVGDEGNHGGAKRGLFARVIGRKEKREGGGAGNEQMYDLVTPLRLDDWG